VFSYLVTKNSLEGVEVTLIGGSCRKKDFDENAERELMILLAMHESSRL